MKQKIRKLFLISIFATFIVLVFLEAGARLFMYFTRGSSTVGVPERTLYLQYQPFVMFGPDWDKVLSFDKYQKIKVNKETYRILLLGGSTAANFPAGLLEKVFSDKFPGYKFEIINAAAGGYNARQELITATIWGPSLKPDIIISLDGANDIIHRLRMERAGTFYLNPTYEFFIRRPGLSFLAALLIKSQFFQGLLRMREKMNVENVYNYIDAIPVYIKAQHSINVLARGMSATRIMVLQPFMAFKQPLSAAEENFKHYKYRESVIRELYKQLNEQLINLSANDNILYVDARFIFNGLSHTIFSDDVHFVKNEGYYILSERIADAISEKELLASFSK